MRSRRTCAKPQSGASTSRSSRIVATALSADLLMCPPRRVLSGPLLTSRVAVSLRRRCRARLGSRRGSCARRPRPRHRQESPAAARRHRQAVHNGQVGNGESDDVQRLAAASGRLRGPNRRARAWRASGVTTGRRLGACVGPRCVGTCTPGSRSAARTWRSFLTRRWSARGRSGSQGATHSARHQFYQCYQRYY